MYYSVLGGLCLHFAKIIHARRLFYCTHEWETAMEHLKTVVVNKIPQNGIFCTSAEILSHFGFGVEWSDFVEDITTDDHDIYQEEIVVIPEKFPWPSFAVFERVPTGIRTKFGALDEIMHLWEIESGKKYSNGIHSIAFSISFWLMLKDGSAHRVELDDDSNVIVDSVEKLFLERQREDEKNEHSPEMAEEIGYKKTIKSSDINAVFERRQIVLSQYPISEDEKMREVCLVKNFLWEERFGREAVRRYIANCLCEKIRHEKATDFGRVLRAIPIIKPNIEHWDER